LTNEFLAGSRKLPGRFGVSAQPFEEVVCGALSLFQHLALTGKAVGVPELTA
jgi:hypothetical protein